MAQLYVVSALYTEFRLDRILLKTDSFIQVKTQTVLKLSSRNPVHDTCHKLAAVTPFQIWFQSDQSNLRHIFDYQILVILVRVTKSSKGMHEF